MMSRLPFGISDSGIDVDVYGLLLSRMMPANNIRGTRQY